MILRYFFKKENPIIGRHRALRNIENEQKNVWYFSQTLNINQICSGFIIYLDIIYVMICFYIQMNQNHTITGLLFISTCIQIT